MLAVMTSESYQIRRILADAAQDRFPSVDGAAVIVEVPELVDRDVILEFTGHVVIVTSRSAAEVREQGPDGFGGATTPEFLQWMVGKKDRLEHHGVVLAAVGEGGPKPSTMTGLDDHPRVRRARGSRTDVVVFGDRTHCVTLGRGLFDRWEVGVEVAEDHQDRGAGRELLDQVRRGVESGEPVFATAAPGNARALRTLLACGFRPIGAEVVIDRGMA